ncbi:hypothetical protein [Streptomyces sp. NPDC059783]|uniref:hypothetical protein n=1 Tax=Streptomyces sp. NPDC059783 TaxID=3346944 RepID=UPI00365B0A71
MPTDQCLIAVPLQTVLEICALLGEGVARDYDDARDVHTQLARIRADFPDAAALPVSVAQLRQLHQVLLVLCIFAGEEHRPGEQVTRFSRMADTVRKMAA